MHNTGIATAKTDTIAAKIRLAKRIEKKEKK